MFDIFLYSQGSGNLSYYLILSWAMGVGVLDFSHHSNPPALQGAKTRYSDYFINLK
jgi:hypothetical protein